MMVLPCLCTGTRPPRHPLSDLKEGVARMSASDIRAGSTRASRLAGCLLPAHHVVSDLEPPIRSITLLLSLSLSTSLVIDQTPSFLTAAT
jgi:hypothetical protein